jgi:hypothetical protein
MTSRIARESGCNRRILKAFYTQYVAVLLIVLVFTIGSFQRASKSGVPVAAATPVVSTAIGNFPVGNVFDEQGKVHDGHARLQALVEVLKAHDLQATIVVPSTVEFKRGEEPTALSSMKSVEALEKFFRSYALPSQAVRFVVRPRLSHETEALHVYFEEVPNESHLL